MIKWLGLLVLSLLIVEFGKIIQGHREVRMLGPHLFR